MSRLFVDAQSLLNSATNLAWLPQWWEDLDHNEDFKQYSNYGLGGAYALIGLVALVQLIRIQLRVPEYGWTTQKLFHLLNFTVAALRASVFFFRDKLEDLDPQLLKVVLLDLPGILFFTTYTLLVLFWAEIYHQARSMPIGFLRPTFITITAVVYTVQVALWIMITWPAASLKVHTLGVLLSDVFLAAVSLSASLGFLLYGGRLLYMLRRFPIESGGRRQKIREVSMVTFICAACFTTRAIMLTASAADPTSLAVDVMDHPLLNIIYYTIVEIMPAAWVLYILRKLPPRRRDGYSQIPTR